jgi:7-cyano-7-deazaguanine synthase
MTLTAKKKAVVLLSGGIDSSTVAAIVISEGYELYALSFDYSQRHSRELESAKIVAEALGAKKHLVVKFDLREIGGSALTADIEVPKGSSEEQKCRSAEIQKSTDSFRTSELPSFRTIPVTYVPARNTIFLSFALAWAEVLEAPDIFIGANAVDYSGYPDCRPEYIKAFEEMANLATKISVEDKIRFRIKAPLIYMTKAEIIKKGTELGFDYSLTWSCYDPQKRQKTEDREQKTENRRQRTDSLSSEIYVPCGKCESCLFRAKGFKEVGLKDPLL